MKGILQKIGLILLGGLFILGSAQAEPFTDNGDGTVTDGKTGLVWQKCSKGQTNDDSCSYYVSKSTWPGALAYCEGLELPTGTTDWRLPNRRELFSLADRSRVSPAIDTDYFPNTSPSDYWSSTTKAAKTSEAWVVSFSGGTIKAGIHKTKFYLAVRCVRGGR